MGSYLLIEQRKYMEYQRLYIMDLRPLPTVNCACIIIVNEWKYRVELKPLAASYNSSP